jgi:cellobiose phosphorylase
VIVDWVLGVRADFDGLVVQPCMPPDWDYAFLRRRFRGADYQIKIQRVVGAPSRGTPTVRVDGQVQPTNQIPPPIELGEHHEVAVRF